MEDCKSFSTWQKRNGAIVAGSPHNSHTVTHCATGSGPLVQQHVHHAHQQNMYVGVSVFFSIFLLRLLPTTRSSVPANKRCGLLLL